MLSIPATVAPSSVLLIVTGYLLGSLSGRRLLGPLRGLVERDAGEGPPRGQRRWSAAAGAIDVGKAALAVWLALRWAPVGDWLSVTAHGYLAGFAALLGHVWPLWHGLRGGRGATALAGALLVLWPAAAVAALIVGLLTLVLSGYLGLATVLGALTLPLLAWLGDAEPPRLAFALAAALLLVFTHRDHLARLRTGTEPRFARARRLHRWRRG